MDGAGEDQKEIVPGKYDPAKENGQDIRRQVEEEVQLIGAIKRMPLEEARRRCGKAL